MKWLLGSVVLLAIVLGVGFVVNDVSAPEVTDDVLPVDGGGTDQFKDELEEEVRIEVGGPAEGFNPASFLKIFPGLNESDFDGVEAEGGTYAYENGELTHDNASSSVETESFTLTDKGLRQLLDNVIARLGTDPKAVKVSEVISELKDQKIHNEYVEVYPGLSILSGETELDLSGRRLTGSLMAEISQVSGLVNVNLADNRFTGLPAEIGQLAELRELNLSNNELTGLPHEIGNLQKLELLNLQGNNISDYDLQVLQAALPETTRIIFDSN